MRGPHHLRAVVAALLALGAAEAVLLLDDEAAFNDFKAIYAPLHTPDAKIVAAVNSPRGDYPLLDDFTERVDTDISNNAGMLGVDGPPRTFGLYRDGNRIAALPSQPGPLGSRLCRGGAGCAALHADPARPGAAGRRLRRVPDRRGARAWAPPRSTCWSRSPCCSASCAHGIGPSPPAPAIAGATISGSAPLGRHRQRTVRHHRPVGRLPRRRRDQRDRLQPGGDRLLPARPGAGRDGVDPGLDPRLPGLCAADAGHGAGGAAVRGHRRPAPRMSWCTARPGTSAS